MSASTRPESDRHLDEAVAARAVREQVPNLECQEARFVGSGWATDVYLVDGRYAVRFPRTAEAAAYVDQDSAVLELVASELGGSIVVPRVLHRGQAGPHFPYDFLVCDFVHGISADDPKAPPSEELTSDLGDALTRVHSISVARARQAGLAQPPWDDYDGPPSFLHLDFRGNNILVDPRSGRLAGIIDWGNAALGDPALDFSCLAVWRGWPFAQAVLDNYAKPVDAGFIERVKQKAASPDALLDV
jgi:aminoglycoside phosphotransferase (APT) family kinase protein